MRSSRTILYLFSLVSFKPMRSQGWNVPLSMFMMLSSIKKLLQSTIDLHSVDPWALYLGMQHASSIVHIVHKSLKKYYINITETMRSESSTVLFGREKLLTSLSMSHQQRHYQMQVSMLEVDFQFQLDYYLWVILSCLRQFIME